MEFDGIWMKIPKCQELQELLLKALKPLSERSLRNLEKVRGYSIAMTSKSIEDSESLEQFATTQ